MSSYEQDFVENYIHRYASVFYYDEHVAYFDDSKEETYDFLSTGLPFLSRYCEIYVSNALQNIGQAHSYHIQVGVHLENNLLKLGIDSIDILKAGQSEVFVLTA